MPHSLTCGMLGIPQASIYYKFRMYLFLVIISRKQKKHNDNFFYLLSSQKHQFLQMFNLLHLTFEKNFARFGFLNSPKEGVPCLPECNSLGY